MRLTTFGALISAGLASCATSLNYIPTREPQHQSTVRGPEHVELFTAAARPARPYVEVGMIESQEERYSLDSADSVNAKMRELAGKHGCDGLVIFPSDPVEFGPQQVGGASRHSGGYRGSCIVYTDANATAPAAAPPSCLPNTTQRCYGPAGCQGGQSCTPDGHGYTPCDCGPNAPPAIATPKP